MTGPSFAGVNSAIIGKEWLYDGTGMTPTPYAHAQSVRLVGTTPKPITLTGSGGTLTYTVITPPAHGTLTGTAPNLTYNPGSGYNGTDSFTFLVNNGTSDSNPATVLLADGQLINVNFTGGTGKPKCPLWTGRRSRNDLEPVHGAGFPGHLGRFHRCGNQRHHRHQFRPPGYFRFPRSRPSHAAGLNDQL